MHCRAADQAAIALRHARLYEMELAEARASAMKRFEALRESKQKIVTNPVEHYRSVYSLTANAFHDINRQTLLRFGKTREELLGKCLGRCFPLQSIPRSIPCSPGSERLNAPSFELESKSVPGGGLKRRLPRKSVSVYLRDISERKQAKTKYVSRRTCWMPSSKASSQQTSKARSFIGIRSPSGCMDGRRLKLSMQT